MFIQSVSMKIPSQQDYERDLKQQLKTLGYKEHLNFDTYKFEHSWNYLGTHAHGQLYKVDNDISSKNRYVVPTYNPQLFLALAGMTDDPIKVGDWVVNLSTSVDYKLNKIYSVDMLEESETYNGRIESIPIIRSNMSSPQSFARKSTKYFRKATKEELIEHFSSVETVSPAGDFGTESVETPKYKVGDRLRIIQNTTAHGFKIGEIVTVLSVSDKTRGTGKGFGYSVKSDSGEIWGMHEVDAVPADQPTRKVTGLIDKQVIHCPTEEEAEAICKLIDDAGLRMCNGNSYITHKPPIDYKPELAYYPLGGQYCSVTWYQNNGYTIFPAKDFLPPSFYNKSNMKRILSRADFKRIHAIACSDWRTKLAEKFKDLLIQDEVDVDKEYYKVMRKACTPEQHKLFDEIFGKDTKEVDLSKYRNKEQPYDDILQVRHDQEYANRAFWLSDKYTWKLEKDSNGQTVLIPTYK